MTRGRDSRSRPRYLARPLALIPSCGARVRDDLTEVVDAVDGRSMPAEGEVGGGQQRPVLRVAAEVVRTCQVIAERPQTAATTLLIPDTVLEGAEERVEGGRRALVRGRDQGAAGTGGPVARIGLDPRQVSLQCRA